MMYEATCTCGWQATGEWRVDAAQRAQEHAQRCEGSQRVSEAMPTQEDTAYDAMQRAAMRGQTAVML